MLFDDYGFLQKKTASATVDMGPLLDMVFILLIFFVITTNFNRQTGVEVQKPKAQSAVSQGSKTIMVGITQEGAIHIHGRQVTADGLEQILAREISQRPDATVVIVGDRGSTLGRSVEVMDLCAKAGVTKVSIAADAEQ